MWEFLAELGGLIIEVIDWRREATDRKADVETARATVISKHFGHRVKFQMDDGSKRSWKVSPEMYNWFGESMTGTLTYKGRIFVDFDIREG